jgi:hypothetical protein
MNLSIRHWPFRLLFLLLPAIPASARAQEAPPPSPVSSTPKRFGESGQFVISAGSTFNVGHATYSGGPGPTPGATTWFEIAPSVDYFVLRGLSLGASVFYEHSAESGMPSSDAIDVGPRVGFNVPIGDHVSFWPTASVLYGDTFVGGDQTSALGVRVSAPLLVHPAPHLFAGIGPSVFSDLLVVTHSPQGNVDQMRATEYSLQLTMGGWL